MLHVKVIAVGRLKEKFWAEACAEYLKRLKSYAFVEVVEVADIDPATCGGPHVAMEREGDAILRAIPEFSYVVLLDIQGKLMSSEAMASQVEILTLEGTSEVVFVVGGSCGVSEAVKQRANEKWSFGRITLPHNLARVVLLEQIYRVFKIIKKEPYHK